MSKRNRLFVGILLVFAMGVGFLLYTVASDLDIRYRESTEQVMVDTAAILAALIETESPSNNIKIDNLNQAFDKAYHREFSAKIYAVTKHRVDLSVYVTDLNGIVQFDSNHQETGKDFRNWHDIHLALDGRYGARTTRNNPNDPATTVMYVALPIFQEENIIGAVCVSKAVSAHRELLLSARQGLVSLGLITLIGFLFLLVTISIGLTSPSRLSHDLIQVFKQEKLGQPKRLFYRLLTVIKSAFMDMRDAMAGRNYSEDYLQSLTHELKSPLTAIRGAAELLHEPMTESQRDRFINNIIIQVQRLQNLAERLLELTSLEKRRQLENPQPILLQNLAEEVLQALEMPAQKKNITFRLTVDNPARVLGDTFLLQRALTNLIENALDFSPSGGAIEITISQNRKQCRIEIRDYGPGIPDYALDRLFHKFYSLQRPDSGQKSTGLGLPFIREIAQLHGGTVSLTNHPKGGALAVFALPLAT